MAKVSHYWEVRGKKAFSYKGEVIYTITLIPFYVERRKLLLDLLNEIISEKNVYNICDFGCGDGY